MQAAPSSLSWWLIYISILLAAFLIACIITPICRKLAWKWNFLDKPNVEGHKLHEEATPVLGGMAMVVSWLICIIGGIYLMFFHKDLLPEGLQTAADGIKDVSERVIVIIGGGVAFWLIGLADDKKPMSAKFKLSLQVAVMAAVAQW